MSSFMSRSYSSGEDESYNAAELEAHLYSQIYHDNQQNLDNDQSSSIVLYQGPSSSHTDQHVVGDDATLLSNKSPGESPGTSNAHKRQTFDKKTQPKFKTKKAKLKNVETSTPNPNFSAKLKLSNLRNGEEPTFLSENESESDFILSEKNSSDEEQLGKYADNINRKDTSKSNKRIPAFVVNISSSDDDCSSDDIQIVSVSSEKEPEIVTLEDSDSIFEDSIVVPPKNSKANFKKLLDKKCLNISKRSERVTIENDKRSKHYVAAKPCSSSDSDFSSYQSDSDESFAIGQSLSLNLSGGRFGNNQRERATRSFQQITGVDPKRHVVSSNKFQSWTPAMKKFYDTVDPSMTDITLEEIVIDLPQPPSSSKSLNFKSGFGNNRRYFNSPRFNPCPHCNLKDHHPRDCKQKGQKKCMMCGKPGHFKLRCPERICLKCGEPGMPYTSSCSACPSKLNKVCFLCGAKGHQQNKCPDLWRRYHATTDPGQIVVPQNTSIDYTKMWCPNCGKKGHLVHQCRAYSFGACPKNVLKVVSYEEQPNHSVSELTGSARRKKLLEVKEKRRAFKTYPHTPKHHPQVESSKTTPCSPHQFSKKYEVEESLIEARRKLCELPTPDNPKSRSGRRKLKKIENNRFPRENHSEKSFPRRPHPGSDQKAVEDNNTLGVFSRLGQKRMPDFIKMPTANGFLGKRGQSPKSPNQQISNGFRKQTQLGKRMKKKRADQFG